MKLESIASWTAHFNDWFDPMPMIFPLETFSSLSDELTNFLKTTPLLQPLWTFEPWIPKIQKLLTTLGTSPALCLPLMQLGVGSLTIQASLLPKTN